MADEYIECEITVGSSLFMSMYLVYFKVEIFWKMLSFSRSLLQIIIIDLILHKPKAYRHLLYNVINQETLKFQVYEYEFLCDLLCSFILYY